MLLGLNWFAYLRIKLSFHRVPQLMEIIRPNGLLDWLYMCVGVGLKIFTRHKIYFMVHLFGLGKQPDQNNNIRQMGQINVFLSSFLPKAILIN
jgi:hypothetical protein